MKKLSITATLLFVFILGLVIVAHSQETANPDPCRADLQQYCKDIKPGAGRIAACMKEHSRELSPACQAHITAIEGNIRLFAKACRGDAQKYCKGVKPGEGRIIFCLKDHEADLSASCQNLLTKQYNK